jgi:hypothetical protein
MITREALRILQNKLVLTRNVNRQYDSSFAQEGAKIGSTLRIRKPDRALVSDGAALQIQDENQQYTTLTVSSQKHIGLAFTSAELTMSIDEFSKNIIEPRVAQLAATIDADVANAFKYIGQSVGTPGTTPGTSQVLLSANQKLNESAAPMDRRFAAVNPAANAGLVEGLKGLFNPVSTVSKQFKSGLMSEGILGLDEMSMTQSIANFTTGSRTSGTTAAAVAANGANTISLSGLGAAGTVKVGDVFTVAECYAVNPMTRQSTGSLFQFVVLADATADGAGAATVTVQAMYDATHALANVNALPASGKAATFLGAASTAYPQNLIAHPDAITFATADLVLPKGVDMASRVQDGGISMRMIRDYDINTDRLATRLDVLYGYAVIRPELAVRLWG